jgi:putative membrane protein
MIPWTARRAFDLLVVGKRLGMVLLSAAAYCVLVTLLVRWLNIRVPDLGTTGSVINTVILGLLLGFRNSVAYQRWWEARGLWGQLTNDSRNLAAKCAAFLPSAVLARSRVGMLLTNFAEALKRHLRDEAPRLRDLPGFESETDDPAHVPLYLARRLFDEMAEWKREGHVDQAVLWLLDAHARGCEKIKNTPLARSYKVLLRAGLVLNVLGEPWLISPENGFLNLPVFLLACFFLFGVELIDTIVEVPFGREPDDLDLDRYCQTIREGVAACLPLSVKS